MSESVSAAITIEGDVIRYAEVERTDGDRRLLRLGRRRVGFDASHVVHQEDEPEGESLDRITTVLTEVLGDTPARELRVAVHPSDGYSFFTPISADLPVRDRKRQLLQQAALVTGARSAQALNITSKTVRTAQDSEGGAVMWVHVLAVPTPVDKRMDRIIADLPVGDHVWILSSEAAARVASHIERSGVSAQQALRPYTLTLGQYPSHTEYALSRNREWYHAHYTEETGSPEDRAYYAVGILNRIDVPLNAVGRLFVYGQEVDLEAYAPFNTIFGLDPESLDPFSFLQTEDGEYPDNPRPFVPCVGAGLDDYVS